MRDRGRVSELVLVVHRWLALAIGLLLLVISVSGALLVFEQPIANAAVMHVTPGGSLLPLDSLAARAVAAAGGGTLVTASVGPAVDAPYGFVVARDSSSITVMVNPYTGEVLGGGPPPTWLERAIRNDHVFHTRLLGGETGRAIVDLVTLASLLLVVTGVIIWWRDRRWKIKWSVSWKRIVFDLHHTSGIIAAIVLLVITGTGVWMGYPKAVDPLVMTLNGTPVPAGQPEQPPPDSLAHSVGLATLVATARSMVPGAPVLAVRTPRQGPVLVTLRYPEDHTPGGRSRVWIDRYRGTVLRVQNTRNLGAGSKLLTLQRPLHTGDIGGVAGSVVWFLSALILGSQAVTGALMWWNGRAARSAKTRSEAVTSE